MIIMDDDPSLINSSNNECSRNKFTIVCDCGYGWPSQKRPKLERQRAVAKQLVNYLESIYCTSNETKFSQENKEDSLLVEDLKRLDIVNEVNENRCKILVMVVGKEEDLLPLYERTQVLLSKLNDIYRSCFEISHKHRQIKHSKTGQCVLQFDSSHGDDLVASATDIDVPVIPTSGGDFDIKGEVTYLSPDSSNLLDSNDPPPRKVIVGMLVDRSIALFRSSKRADSSGIESACLPLNDCMTILESQSPSSDDIIRNDEPLNIDTILTLMHTWYDEWHHHGKASNAIENKAIFVSSAAKAILSHQDRHPNRTLHK